MYATNLAIVFGPTLLQPAPSPASFATTMSNLGHHQTIVKYLILHYHYLFDIEEEEEEADQELGDVDDDDDSETKTGASDHLSAEPSIAVTLSEAQM